MAVRDIFSPVIIKLSDCKGILFLATVFPFTENVNKEARLARTVRFEWQFLVLAQLSYCWKSEGPEARFKTQCSLLYIMI